MFKSKNITNKFKRLLNEDLEYFFLSLFFISLPLKNNYNTISILLLVLLSISRLKSIQLNKLLNYKASIVYFVLACVSLLYTSNLNAGQQSILGHSLFLIIPLLFTIFDFRFHKIKLILQGFVIWICCLALYSELAVLYEVYLSGEKLNVFFRKDYSYIFLGNRIGIHPPYMALYTSFSIFLLISMLGKNIKKNLLCILGVLLLSFHTIHLSSRLPIATLSVIGLILSFQQLKKHHSHLKSFIILFICSGVILSLLFSVRSTRYRFMELFGMQYDSGLYIKSGPSKIAQWKAAYYANSNTFIGEGIGDANEKIIASNTELGLIKNANRKYNAHNQYLQTYVGLGALGLMVLLWMFYSAWHKKPSDFKINNYFLIYILIVFLTESYFQRHHGLAFIIFFLSLAIQSNKQTYKASTKKLE